MGILDFVGNIFTGPGALDSDPRATFKRYAAPGLLDVFSPEQQSMLGEQIQGQMRRINADYRPSQKDISDYLMKAAETQIKMEEARRARAAEGRLRGGINTIMGGDPLSDPTQPGRPMSAEDALVGGGGPTVANAAKIGAVTPAGPADARKAYAQRYLKLAQLHAAEGDDKKAKTYAEVALSLDPNIEFDTTPKTLNQNGAPTSVLVSKTGDIKPIQGFTPPAPAEVAPVEYIMGRSMAGTGPAGLTDLKSYNESKSTKNNVNVSTGQKGIETLITSYAKNLPELEAQARAAARTNQALADIVTVSDKGTFSGKLAPGAVGAAQFLQSFGMNPAPDKLANTREFEAGANILVLDFMSAMGGAKGFSKEESAILYDAFPKIIDSPDARRRIAQMLLTRNNRILQEYESAKKQFGGFVGSDLGFMPSFQGGTLPNAPAKPLDQIFKK